MTQAPLTALSDSYRHRTGESISWCIFCRVSYINICNENYTEFNDNRQFLIILTCVFVILLTLIFNQRPSDNIVQGIVQGDQPNQKEADCLILSQSAP